MNYVFTTLMWALLFFAVLSLFTSLRIAFKVFRGTVDSVNLVIFCNGWQRADTASRRPGISFVLIFLFDIASLNALLAIMYSDSLSLHLEWSILLLVLLCYTIKGLYFIRVFHRLGVLDDDDLETLRLGNKDAG